MATTMLHGSYALVRLASGNFSLEMSLLIEQVLELEMQAVNFLTRLGRLGLCFARGEAGIPMESSQMRNVCEEELLLLRDVCLLVGREGPVADFVDDLDEGFGLIACLVGDLQDSDEAGLGDNLVDGHGAVMGDFEDGV